MPMIDVCAAAGTFADTKRLAADLAATLMSVEQVPDIPLFRKNTAAFILLTEAPEGGWGLAGHANTNAELVAAARAQLAEIAANTL